LELHIAFGYSAAADLRSALAGREAAVARFSDDLSYGPINPLDTFLRRAWIDQNLGFDNPDITDDEETFWAKILEEDTSRIAWFSRRSAAEYCAFLEYLRRLGGRPTQVVDTTDVRDDRGEFFQSTAVIPADYILRSNLVSRARDADAIFRADCRALWEALRTDNTTLRIVDQNLSLSSVPIGFYDEQLLSLASSGWRPMARIVGEMLADGAESDLLLFSRLYFLLDAGALVARESDKRHPDVKRVDS
jgi:hypothetical protein